MHFKLECGVIIPFIVFFGVFGFIYPSIHLFHTTSEAYWLYRLFYILADIWGSAMLALMFWQFSNYIVTMDQAKRFYILLTVAGNIALVLSGLLSANLYKHVTLAMAVVVIMGLIAIYAYHWMHKEVLSNEQKQNQDLETEQPGFFKNLKIVFSSSQLWLIVLVTIAFAVVSYLIEALWKNQLGLFCSGDRGLFNYYMGGKSTATGIFATIFAMCFGINILRKSTWQKAASISPKIALIFGSMFFCLILAKSTIEPITMKFFNISATAFVMFTGLGTIIAVKTVAFTFLGATKEMIYIPLNSQLQTKGRAVMDVMIAGYFSKFFPVIMINRLIYNSATKDFASITPTVFAIFIIASAVWLFAVKALSKKVTLSAAK